MQNGALSTSAAIIIGSVLISLAILMSGGVVRVEGLGLTKKTAGTVPTAPTVPTQPSGEGAAQAPKDFLANLKAQATTLKLDQKKFDSCLDSGVQEGKVSADLAAGQEAGVTGTPAFFVNGRLIPGAVPLSEFKKVIDEELNGTAPADTERKTVGVGDLPAKGDPNAKVTVVEFSDYQCPFCERFYTQTELQLRKDYVDTGKVKFYYRDFPLSQIHPGAQKGAEAARCAGEQNKYWEYHDLVFQNQGNIF